MVPPDLSERGDVPNKTTFRGTGFKEMMEVWAGVVRDVTVTALTRLSLSPGG